MSAKATQEEVEAPRQEADLWGEPVMERRINDEYWEGYVPDDHQDRVLIAKYELHDGEWIKTGLERMNITEIHMEAFKRRKGGD